MSELNPPYPGVIAHKMGKDNIAEFVKVAAQAVLHRVGGDLPLWEVLRIERRPDSAKAGELAVTIGVRDAPASEVVYFSADVPQSQAMVTMADGIQDHAIDATWGEPLPPCPGHQHPLSAKEIDGTPSWVCPTTPSTTICQF